MAISLNIWHLIILMIIGLILLNIGSGLFKKGWRNTGGILGTIGLVAIGIATVLTLYNLLKFMQ